MTTRKTDALPNSTNEKYRFGFIQQAQKSEVRERRWDSHRNESQNAKARTMTK